MTDRYDLLPLLHALRSRVFSVIQKMRTDRGQQTLAALLVILGIVLLIGTPLIGAALAEPISTPANSVSEPTAVAIENTYGGGRVQAINPSGEVLWQIGEAQSYHTIDQIGPHRYLATFTNVYEGGVEECGRFNSPCDKTGYRIIDTTNGSATIIAEYTFPVRTGGGSEVRSAEQLPNGNVLLADQEYERLIEVNSQENITWQWNASQYYTEDVPDDPTQEQWVQLTGVDRLSNGQYLVTVSARDELLIVDRNRGVVQTINATENNSTVLNNPTTAQSVGEGSILVADTGNSRVIELYRNASNNSWEIVWELTGTGDIPFDLPRDADRLPNGDTLIVDSRNNRLVQVNEQGKTQWAQQVTNLPYSIDRINDSANASTLPSYGEHERSIGAVHTTPQFITDIEIGVRYLLALPYWVTGWHILFVGLGIASLLTGAGLGVIIFARKKVDTGPTGSFWERTDFSPLIRTAESSNTWSEGTQQIAQETVDQAVTDRMTRIANQLGLIMLGFATFTYANLIAYNTGDFTVFNQSGVTFFSYNVPVAAVLGAIALYLVGFVSLIAVDSSVDYVITKVGWLTPVIYLVVGTLFLQNVFRSSHIQSRVMGGMTDAYVLQYWGAERLLNGVNPYEGAYVQAILENVPGYFRTPTVSQAGGVALNDPTNIVTQLDYAFASVLWYVPAQVLGISGATWDLAIMVVIVLLLIAIAPRTIKPFIPVFLLLDWNLIIFPSSFVPDMGWVLPIVLAMLWFHKPVWSAGAFAFAASYRPQPILIAPFFGIMAVKYYGWDYLRSWVPAGLGITALLNVPIMLWTGPAQFLNQTLIPLTLNLPPGGVGPAGLLRYFIDSGAVTNASTIRPLFTVAVLGVWGLGLVFAWYYYEHLGVGIFAIPGLALFFHWRSFQNYFLWFPLIVLYAYALGIPYRNPWIVLTTKVDSALSTARTIFPSAES